MIIFKKIADLQQYFSQSQHAKRPVGFIPTMGALHAGHRSLIDKGRASGQLVVCSIFVNPTQFNDKTDFEKYPITLDADIEMLIGAGCDILFLPSVDEIYPDGTDAAKTYDFGYLETILEGAYRPGHFKGVGQVVARLLDAVKPQYLYLGQKDYQQCMVLRDLVGQMGIKDLEVIISPTVREADGLAMSSRNVRLTEPQRAKAGIIYQCLVSIQSKQEAASFAIVQKECTELLRDKGFEPDYVALADARDLMLLNEYKPGTPMVALIAAKLGSVRLIDNLLL